MACWLPNHLAHCGEDLPQLLSHQRHIEVSFCVAALSKTTLSTTNNFDKLSKGTWQQQIKTRLFCSTWISTQCSWAGANSWLLPVPSQDRGEHFEQSTKSSTRERDDQHDHDKQQWVSPVPTKKTTWMTTIWLAGGQQRQGWTTADWTEHGAGKILSLLESMI